MENGIIQFILNSFISISLFLTVYYLYLKLSVLQTNSIYRKLFIILSGCLIVAIGYSCLYYFNSAFAQIASYIFPSIFFIIFEKESIILKSITCFILACITRILSIIPAFFISITLANYLPIFILYPIIYIITFALAVLFTKIKRFRQGIQFFENEKSMGLGFAITGFVFIFLSFTYTHEKVSDWYKVLILCGLLITAIGLFLWIKRSITAHYRERLQLKSEEHFQSLLQEKDLENQKLNQTNEYLAKVVHRDNHLMSALNTSINAYFESDNEQDKDDLLREIQTLAKERGELIENEQRNSKLFPTTGNLLTDGAVNDLYVKAAAHGIDFNLTVSETVDAIIGKYISQTDLQTLLCDHIKDAIIAVDAAGNDKGKILVNFSVKNGNYQITVFDSGVDFEIDTLAKLGKERVTTHADSGGSGIGFMTTFETLRKAYASLMITEFAHKTPFSKSVSIIFDGENSFIIQSYRSDILKTAINRDDMVII